MAERAALAAGFPVEASRCFARATLLHLADNGPAASLIEALADPADSPVLRLPLLLQDILRVAKAMPGPLELSVQPADTALAPAYIGLLPVLVDRVDVVPVPEGPSRVCLSLDLSRPGSRNPPGVIEVPAPVLDRFRRLTGGDHKPEASPKGSTG